MLEVDLISKNSIKINFLLIFQFILIIHTHLENTVLIQKKYCPESGTPTLNEGEQR
jgi:hypothetical protein